MPFSKAWGSLVRNPSEDNSHAIRANLSATLANAIGVRTRSPAINVVLLGTTIRGSQNQNVIAPDIDLGCRCDRRDGPGQVSPFHSLHFVALY